MKLQRLHIKGFRNIEDLDLDLSAQNGLSVLIGNNGSGKSNILEAVVAIFASLYSKSKRFFPTFDYDIEYKLQEKAVKVSKVGDKILVDDIEINRRELSKLPLPKNVIACYSGETLRLQEDYFKPFRRHFVHDIIRNRSELNSLKLLFINKDMWDISLLVLFLHNLDDFTEIKEFCHNVLNIEKITSINFELAPKLLTKANAAKQLIDAISPKGDRLVTKTFEEFSDIIERLGMTIMKEVFMALYVGLYSHGIKSVNIEIESKSGKLFRANLLSEGEKKLLSVFTMLEVLGDESSLMIYDEPDSQIHISRKVEIKKLIERYDNRQHIITTHSPTLAAAFFDSSKHLNCLAKNSEGHTEKIDKDKCSLIAELTDNIWTVTDQNTFLASNKPITLLVEGKTDRIHIEEAYRRLKDDYRDLDFDIFHCSGATNIPQFITGLKTCEIDFSKRVIIAVFDNDKEGRDCCNQTQVKYTKGEKNKYGLYALTLPLLSDGTIENMYDQSKYDTAFKTVVNRNAFGGIVSEYAEFITKQAKIELSNNTRGFDDNDFDKFRSLFDIIKEIKQLL